MAEDQLSNIRKQAGKKKTKRKAAKKKRRAKKKTSKKAAGAEDDTPVHPHVTNPPENDRQDAEEQHGTTVTITFQARHYEWLERMAAIEKRTVESMVEKLVRSAWAMDPTKGGTRGVMTKEDIEALKNS